MKLYLSRAEQYAVVVLLMAIFGAVVVLSFALGKRQGPQQARPFYDQGLPADQSAPGQILICVHVTGAVKSPGLCSLPPGSRINDALARACPRADSEPSALNLAARLEDGQRIYVPTKAQWAKWSVSGGPPLVTTGSAASTAPIFEPADNGGSRTSHRAKGKRAKSKTKPLPSTLVALNTASVNQLMKLPGVGPSTAEAIIRYRTKNGPFQEITELLNVPGISIKTFKKLEQYLCL